MIGVEGARIRWRCRRGVKELDILMERFAAERLPDLSPELARDFDRLLDETDPDLLDWITGRAPPASASYLPLITMLRELRAAGTLPSMNPADSYYVILPDLACVSVAGTDAGTFLHGQFCADLLSVPDGGGCLTAWCTAQGRVITTLFAQRTAAGWTLILPGNLAGEVLKRLRMFVLRAKVEIRAAPEAVVLGLGEQTAAAARSAIRPQLLPVAGHGDSGRRYLMCMPRDRWDTVRANVAGTSVEMTPAEWAREDIQAALPWIDAGTTGQFLPQELELERWQGLSYSKGCYPGQEIIARLRYRGTVKRGLCRIGTPAAAQIGLQSGTRLMDTGGKPVATVLYGATVWQDQLSALAVVDLASPAHSVLHTADGTSVTVQFLRNSS